jgi:hypothetical protein
MLKRCSPMKKTSPVSFYHVFVVLFVVFFFFFFFFFSPFLAELVGQYADHPVWASCVGSTLKFCNLRAFDAENEARERLLCVKKMGPNLFELRFVKASGETVSRVGQEKVLAAVDSWMARFAACTYVEWIPRFILSSSVSVGSVSAELELEALAASPLCPTSSLTSRRAAPPLLLSPHSEVQSSCDESGCEALVLELLASARSSRPSCALPASSASSEAFPASPLLL